VREGRRRDRHPTAHRSTARRRLAPTTETATTCFSSPPASPRRGWRPEASRLDRSELAEHAFVAAADLDQCLSNRLVRRSTASLAAIADWRTSYLEYGHERVALPN
jgi:hypothetical protein